MVAYRANIPSVPLEMKAMVFPQRALSEEEISSLMGKAVAGVGERRIAIEYTHLGISAGIALETLALHLFPGSEGPGPAVDDLLHGCAPYLSFSRAYPVHGTADPVYGRRLSEGLDRVFGDAASVDGLFRRPPE